MPPRIHFHVGVRRCSVVSPRWAGGSRPRQWRMCASRSPNRQLTFLLSIFFVQNVSRVGPTPKPIVPRHTAFLRGYRGV